MSLSFSTATQYLGILEKRAHDDSSYAIRDGALVVAAATDSDRLEYDSLSRVIYATFVSAYNKSFLTPDLLLFWTHRMDCLSLKLAEEALSKSKISESVVFASQMINAKLAKDIFSRMIKTAIEKREFALVMKHLPSRCLDIAFHVCIGMVRSDQSWLVYEPLEALAEAYAILPLFDPKSMPFARLKKTLGELLDGFLIQMALTYVRRSPNFKSESARVLANHISEPNGTQIQRLIFYKNLTLYFRREAALRDPKTSPDSR